MAQLLDQEQEGRGGGSNLAREPQPDPLPSVDIPIIKTVMLDFLARAEMGKEKYGVYLCPNNGRDSLWDAYQEAVDLCMYLRQKITERDEQDEATGEVGSAWNDEQSYAACLKRIRHESRQQGNWLAEYMLRLERDWPNSLLVIFRRTEREMAKMAKIIKEYTHDESQV